MSNSAPATSLVAVAGSADGSKLLLPNLFSVYLSKNSGGSWTGAGAPSGNWVGAASSASGGTLAVLGRSTSTGNGLICVSTNLGTNWSSISLPGNFPESVALSADGSKLAVATANGGLIYVSTNNGTTWITNNAPAANWYSIAISADGAKLVAGVNAGPIYASTDGGVAWAPAAAPAGIEWNAVASSADGSRLVAMAASGQIYTWQYAPVLGCVSSNGAAVVSWPDSVYTNLFTLQTNGDLTTTNWADAGLPVNDDGTNQSVTITPPSDNLFFRLLH